MILYKKKICMYDVYYMFIVWKLTIDNWDLSTQDNVTKILKSILKIYPLGFAPEHVLLF